MQDPKNRDPKTGHLLPGHTLSKGRPPGARRKIQERFLKDFLKAWEELGADAITTMAEKHPTEFVKVAASLLPKDVNIGGDAVESLVDYLKAINAQSASTGPAPALPDKSGELRH